MSDTKTKPADKPTPAPVPAATVQTPAIGTTPVPAPAPTVVAKNTTEILGKDSGIPIPQGKRPAGRGGQSKYDFDSLEVGDSIAIKGRKANGLQSTVSQKNRDYLVAKRDGSGAIIYKKNADGTNSDKPETIATKRFAVYDMDPKTDPRGADCRIFRVAIDGATSSAE